MGFTFITGEKNYNDVDFRRIQIAENLHVLGKHFKNQTSAAIIYPPGHWYGDVTISNSKAPGIFEYLTNDALRIAGLKRFDRYRKDPKYSDLFAIRNWQFINGMWQRINQINTLLPNA